MKNKKIREAWNKIEPDQAADERMRKVILLENRTGKKKWHVFVPVALSFALVLLIAIPLLNDNRTAPPLPVEVVSSEEKVASVESEVEEPRTLTFNLEKSSLDIQISLVEEKIEPAYEATYQASLVGLSEEELLSDNYYRQEIASFSGTVTSIHNIVIAFPQWDEYWSVIEFEIIEDFRTNLDAGTVVTVRMPGHINGDGVGYHMMETAGLLKVGSKAIMMPVIYSDTSTFSADGQTLYLSEIAEYGVLDGLRWLFVETPEEPEEIVFAEHAYPSFLEAKTLEDVATILRGK